jgi:protease PrsW
MNFYIYLSFTIAPILIIFGLLIYYYGFEIKKVSGILSAVVLGMFSVVIILAANYLIDTQWHGNYGSLRRILFFVLIVIALSAEIGKFLVLRIWFYNRSDVKGPIEGIIYSIFIGLGYATIATVLFAYNIIGTHIQEYHLVFLYTYPLANVVFAVCIGFFIGMGKIRKNILIDNATGLFVSIFFHGLYCFSFISHDIVLILFTLIGFLIISITLLVRAINLRKAKED